jgi:metal-dependent amidase/aminoacylase/carboxypeptidase family protein
MGAEDFGSFSELAPGAMFGLGCRIEGDERQHHNPRFDIDEACLPIGTAILAEAALRLLARQTG